MNRTGGFILMFIFMAALLTASAFAGTPGYPPERAVKAAVEKCIAEKEKANTTAETCVGVHANACLEKSDDSSTYGMMACSTKETDVWEERLNRDYQKLMKEMKTEDKERLRDMQRAWIAFREKKCGFHQREQEGTSVMPLNAYCYMEETGRQSLFLRDIESGQ